LPAIPFTVEMLSTRCLPALFAVALQPCNLRQTEALRTMPSATRSAAFEELALPLFPSLYNHAFWLARDHAEAEDLVQELFLFIFQKGGAFDAAKGSAVSWIIQMAYHRAIDRRRYLGFRQHYNGQELNEDRLIGNRGQISIDELAGKAVLNRLREELSADQQQTLELHFFEGYSFREIADKTGQAIGNVRNHYYRGIERLRSHIFPGKISSK